MKRHLRHIAVFLVVAALYSLGAVEFLERAFLDARFRVLTRPPTGNVVLVEMDVASLARFDSWPWPRSLYARALTNLLAAGAQRVALDIDLSSRSTPQQDAALAAAIENGGERVILATFQQYRRTGNGRDGMRLVDVTPNPAIATGGRLASINVIPDPDGLVRMIPTYQEMGFGTVPALSVAFAGTEKSAGGMFYVDYGIDAKAIPRLSFADVVDGRFNPESIAGKAVIIGATAIELGDQVAVPIHRVLPGSVVQALATESQLQGRALERLASLPVLAVALLVSLLLCPVFERMSWRRGLLCLGGLAGGTAALAVGIQALLPLIVDTVPVLLTIAGGYVVALAFRIDRQDLRLIAQSLDIHRRNAFMRMVVDNSFDGIITVNSDNLVRTFNQAAEGIFGYGAAEVVGQPFDRLFVAPDEQPPATGGNAILAVLGGSPEERLGVRRSGERFPVTVAVTKMHIRSERVHIVQVRDLSAQNDAEARAEEARNRLRDAIDHTAEGFMLFDAEDRLIMCNQVYRELFPSGEAIAVPGRRFEDMLREWIGRGELADAAENPEEWIRWRLERHSRNGNRFDMRLAEGKHVRVSERRTGDGGTVIVYTDISADREREETLEKARLEAESANRAKSEFLANMSHELRTPLNAIIGFSEIMESELLGPIGTPAYRGYAADVQQAGKHLLDVINDILDVSRIEAGQYVIREEPLDLNRITDTCVRMVNPRVQQAKQTLECHLPDPLPVMRGDQRVLKQVLINLLSNATKFTPEGGRIGVDVALCDDGGLEIRVSDNGVGMAKEDIPRALSVFGQVDSRLARAYEGTGLGLPLVKSYVELHGGTLNIESEPAVGTTVTAHFPAERVMGSVPAIRRREDSLETVPSA